MGQLTRLASSTIRPQALLLSLAAHLNTSQNLLGSLFFGPERGNWAIEKISRGLEGIPESWIQFFELDETIHGCDCEPSANAADTPDDRIKTIAHTKLSKNFPPARRDLDTPTGYRVYSVECVQEFSVHGENASRAPRPVA